MSDDALARGPTVLADGGDAAAPGDERLAAGARAGEYEVVRFLGAGAMGDVYAGRHPLIGKRVAIKVIKRRLAASPEAAQRFLREAQAANQVGHPDVVEAFALGRLDDGRLYLVMDLLDGAPLSARLAQGRVPPAEALAILERIAAALDAAHARGVVHRDLKPDNVFLTDGGGGAGGAPRVHVLDFGIAKLLGGDAPIDALTGEGAWLGTPAYMAPEQWSADGAGPASDRYALAVLAYQLLSGDVPFRARSLPQMMEQHFRAPVPPLSTGAGALPPAVDEVLARGLAKDPDARFASAAALVDALAAALGTARGAARPGVGAAGQGAARAHRSARSRAALGLGAAAALAVTAGGVIVVARDRGAAPAPAPGADDRGASRGGSVAITSTPPGAVVRRGGAAIGTTPVRVDAAPGDEVAVALSRPGYVGVTRRAIATAAGARLDVTLAPVTGFEGTWAMADGTLRAFERRDDQVAAFALDRADGPRRLLRMFDFAGDAAPGAVVFTAAEEHVDERAPDEPSCHLSIRSAYTYDPAADTLRLRRERANYDLIGGRCVVHATGWGDPIPMTRVAGPARTWAEATGAGAPEAPPELKVKRPRKAPRPAPPPVVGPNRADAASSPDAPISKDPQQDQRPTAPPPPQQQQQQPQQLAPPSPQQAAPGRQAGPATGGGRGSDNEQGKGGAGQPTHTSPTKN